MEKIKRNWGRFLGIGLAAALVAVALYFPRAWFALRDAASQGRIQEESLAPLMVAPFDRSYERDIYERMRAYIEAYAQGDVNCSAKEIDPESETLQENIDDGKSSLLLEALIEQMYVRDAKMYGWIPTIESCTQYVLMRKSDGQILLVANDIRLDKGDGCHMELLLDGVDGTVYYLQSEEYNFGPRLKKWLDDRVWDWWWILNESYCTEDIKSLNESYEEQPYDSDRILVGTDGVIYDTLTGQSVNLDINWDKNQTLLNGGTQFIRYAYPNLWVSVEKNKETYCCLLSYGELSHSWSMEIESLDSGNYQYRIRLGLPGIVKSIPEMAARISLAEYEEVYDAEESEEDAP